jgi:hypothetical protein
MPLTARHPQVADERTLIQCMTGAQLRSNRRQRCDLLFTVPIASPAVTILAQRSRAWPTTVDKHHRRACPFDVVVVGVEVGRVGQPVGVGEYGRFDLQIGEANLGQNLMVGAC